MTAAAAPSISIVVISYNYAEFLPAAIESALAQEHPVEVLVVDDGSTDGSREIIAGYGDRIRTLFKENGGNSSVVNAAVPATTGDVIMFLDADDLLRPTAAEEVVRAWRDGCAKVQFRLSLIDAAGERKGVDPPASVAMPTGDVVPQLLATGRYVTPVTTGNAFRRSVLERLLPIPEDDFRNTDDGYLNPLCPFYGEVVSVDRELGSYRLHGRNLWAFTGEFDLSGVRRRVSYDVVRHRYLASAARRHGYPLPPALLLLDPVHVLQRLVSLRAGRSEHPAPGDSAVRLLYSGLRAVLRSPHSLDPAQRGAVGVALPLVAVLPVPLALRVCGLVLASRPRPLWVRRLAALLRRTGGSRSRA